MAFNFECDFSLQARRLTPITKRQDVRLDFLTCTSEPLQWNRDNFFNAYLNGDSSAAFNIVTSYSRYDRVNYQNKIYECISPIAGEYPTNESYWVLVSDDFRGATERVKYNCQTIILEWVLNKWFGTTFNQPSTLITSDFWIQSNDREADLFYVSEDTYLDGVYMPSVVPQFSSGAIDYVGDSSVISLPANFTVNYPLATIPLITDDKYYQMVDLINKYKIAGSTVDYIGY